MIAVSAGIFELGPSACYTSLAVCVNKYSLGVDDIMHFSRNSYCYLEDDRQKVDNLERCSRALSRQQNSVPKSINLQSGHILSIFDKTGPQSAISSL